MAGLLRRYGVLEEVESRHAFELVAMNQTNDGLDIHKRADRPLILQRAVLRSNPRAPKRAVSMLCEQLCECIDDEENW